MPGLSEISALCPNLEAIFTLPDSKIDLPALAELGTRHPSVRCVKLGREITAETYIKMEEQLRDTRTLDLTTPTTAALHSHPAGSAEYQSVERLLSETWTKTELYELSSVVQVQEIVSDELKSRHHTYRSSLPSAAQAVELSLFHGCDDSAIDSIALHGFKSQFQKTEVWQRFGKAFYFAMDSSKAHT